MERKAVEKFLYKPLGPYTISKKEASGGTSKALLRGISRKRVAIATAKKILRNGNFKIIVVQDFNGTVLYSQEKTPVEKLKTDIRFRALLRLLISAPKMAQNYRHMVMAKFVEEYEDMFPVAVGDAWTEEEDEALRILVELGAPDNSFIGDLLGRSESGVSHRLKRMDFPSKQVMNRRPLF